jgi:hypothetical protein
MNTFVIFKKFLFFNLKIWDTSNGTKNSNTWNGINLIDLYSHIKMWKINNVKDLLIALILNLLFEFKKKLKLSL